MVRREFVALCCRVFAVLVVSAPGRACTPVIQSPRLPLLQETLLQVKARWTNIRYVRAASNFRIA